MCVCKNPRELMKKKKSILIDAIYFHFLDANAHTQEKENKVLT